MAPLRGGCSEVLRSNSRHARHESVTLTTRLPRLRGLMYDKTFEAQSFNVGMLDRLENEMLTQMLHPHQLIVTENYVPSPKSLMLF
ncbi:hypothetical protein TNCV_1719521 [Trichonephila clavipes]|nr:hypothetical protein TNCV_1719521 [Trichonephila clavipes]